MRSKFRTYIRFHMCFLLLCTIIICSVFQRIQLVESRIAIIIKIEGKKGAGNDFFIIGGKNCDTPTLIKKGKGKSKSKRGKIIIIEKECQSQNSYTKIPVFVPTYSHSTGY